MTLEVGDVGDVGAVGRRGNEDAGGDVFEDVLDFLLEGADAVGGNSFYPVQAGIAEDDVGSETMSRVCIVRN